MSFTVVHPTHSQTLWAPVEVSETVYNGSIIGCDTATPLSGVQPMPVAAGAANVTNLDVPLGVVIGNNNVAGNVVYNSTYNTEYITAGTEASAHAQTTQFQNVEGPLRTFDFAMVQYIPITAETVIRGPIYNAAYGTAPTLLTVTNDSTDGLDFAANANEATSVANFATAYMRTGAAKGEYRRIVNASSTSWQNTPAFKGDVMTGDTGVVVNGLNYFGLSRAYIDAEGMYIDSNAELTANYLLIDVIRLDLSEAGNEYVEFRFSGVNFQHTVRLNTTA